jgi:hypothetical protein
MIIIVLIVVTMFLWFLSNLPVQAAAPYAENGRRWLAFIAVLLVCLYLFIPALRGGPY